MCVNAIESTKQGTRLKHIQVLCIYINFQYFLYQNNLYLFLILLQKLYLVLLVFLTRSILIILHKPVTVNSNLVFLLLGHASTRRSKNITKTFLCNIQMYYMYTLETSTHNLCFGAKIRKIDIPRLQTLVFCCFFFLHKSGVCGGIHFTDMFS